MRALSLALLLPLTACTSHLHDDFEESEPPELEEQDLEIENEDGPASPASQNDLELRLSYDGKRRLEPGQPFDPVWTLHNLADESRYYVQPGDGSAVGWREPHVYYTATRQLPDGTWVDVEGGNLARCGMFDNDWHDEIAELHPGASAKLEWLPSPAWQLRLQESGKVRLVAHYEFSAGAGFGNSRGTSESLAQMEDVPAFHLTSAPLEIEIVRPLALELTPKPGPERGSRLSQFFELTLENESKATRTLAQPNWMNIRAELRKDGEIIASLNDPDWEQHKAESTFRLQAGHHVEWLGSKVDFELHPDHAGPGLEVNVIYSPGDHEAGRIETGWVPLPAR